MLQPHASRSRLFAAAVAFLAATSSAKAQVIAGINAYSVISGTNRSLPYWRTNTQGNDPLSNTFITRGTNPSTDAFLYDGNAPGNLLGSGITLNRGANDLRIQLRDGKPRGPSQLLLAVLRP